jgi:hypothetical protein
MEETGICVCDIDDTLLKADPKIIGIWKTINGKETRLTTEEFAKDTDKDNPEVKYSYREFLDPKKVRDSIFSGTPLIKNLKIVDKYINQGYDFAFLTARAAEDVIKEVLEDYMRVNRGGTLHRLGSAFQKGLSFACNDEKYCEVLDNLKDAERKTYFLKRIAEMYDHVVFIDDDERNLKAADAMHLPNLDIVKATN